VTCVAACTSASGTQAMFAVETPGDDFYALPFPNDIHRKADGSLDLSLFPTNSQLVDSYRAAAETLDGFSLNGAISSRFTAALDPASLPDPAGSLEPSASVYLLNVDGTSADYGTRTPIIATYRDDKTNTIGPDRLVVRPYPGFGLDEGTTYALVITNAVKDVAGAAVVRAPEFDTLLGSGGGTAMIAARAAYKPLTDWLGANGGTADVVSAAVFTTEHATQIGPALRKGVYSTPAPVATNVTNSNASTALYHLWTGAYMAPNFQTGTPPYLSGGGEIVTGPDGAAVVQRTEPMRFALTIPPGTKPAGGWPLCIYSHGTGGDYESFVDDGTGARLAAEGIATISTDQVLHGPRDPAGTDPGVAFFNFTNPFAGRDNALQGAADAWSQMRLAQGLVFDDGNGGFSIDPAKIYFFGHSQGGLTGPAFIAFEPALSGAVLSGTGGLLYLSMLYKTAPIDFPSLIETIARDSPMDEDNPSLAIAQMWIERADGANYARYMVREPQLDPTPGHEGTQMAAKNIFQTEGFTDTYAPNPAIEAFATAIGGDLVVETDEQPVTGLALRGKTAALATPITDNAGTATAVLAQFKMRQGSDGHFVVFEVPAAEKQSADFLGTLAAAGKATVVVP
jgi:predicted esterase